KVASRDLDSHTDVVAELELNAAEAPVRRHVSVSISSLNLLGQKYVAVDKGNANATAPSGFSVPRSRIGTSTDLDQVIGVRDADTRAQLAVLINEAGAAMIGRRADFNALLGELPRTTVEV